MLLPQEKKEYTLDFIYALPDGTRAELIDGKIYYMAPPSRKHQEIAVELLTIINNYIKNKGGSCKPYTAPFAVFLNESDAKYVEPDLSVGSLSITSPMMMLRNILSLIQSRSISLVNFTLISRQ